MVDKMSQKQIVHKLFIYRVYFKIDYMFRPFTLGHHQVISFDQGNYTMNNTICGIRSLLFNEISLNNNVELGRYYSKRSL